MALRLDFKRALLGAAAVHAALFFVAALRSRHPRGERTVLREVAGAPDTVDLYFEPPPPPSAPSPPPSAAPDVQRSAAVASVVTPSAPAGVDRAQSADAPSPSVVSAAPATSDGESWTFSPFTAPTAIGVALGDGEKATRAALRASIPEAPPAAPGAAALEGMHAALDAHDRELGLGAGGPLVNLTRSAVRDSLAPSIGHAFFEFSTDSAGLVLSVRVLDVSSDRKAWDDVAAKLVETSRAHPLRVPPGAHGVAVTLRVDSVVHTKSGHDAGESSVSLLGMPIKKSRAPHPVHTELSIPIASVNIDPTDLLLDATSKPERIVSAWIVGERRL